MTDGKKENRVTLEGRRMGLEMARLCDREVEKFIRDGEWREDERCASCAFRKGTVPNGCLQTQLDVMKSVLEQQVFFCHVDKKVCSGWFASVQAIKDKPIVFCPWEFSAADPPRKR